MKFPIGFRAETRAVSVPERVQAANIPACRAVRSLVDIHFPARGMTLTYYNDQFDLAPGDLVYVDGKLEGKLGRVMKVSRQFKIKPSEYKRVIAKADTQVHGQLYMLGSHVAAFDRDVIPYSNVLGWFKPPMDDEEEYVVGDEEGGFPLDNLREMDIQPEVAERGYNYYMENRVAYLALDGTHGRAIVEGTEPYELEFECIGGEIRNLVCNCFCCYNCKHEFAAMLQLRDSLDMIEKNYRNQYAESGYFAVLSKSAFKRFVFDHMQTGSIDFR